MKVILPNQTTYTITVIPRFNIIGTDISVIIYSEELREEQTNNATSHSLINGLLDVTFTSADFTDLTFTEKQTYQIHFLDVDTSETLYRGKMLVTSQTPQDYRLDDGLYTYN